MVPIKPSHVFVLMGFGSRRNAEITCSGVLRGAGIRHILSIRHSLNGGKTGKNQKYQYDGMGFIKRTPFFQWAKKTRSTWTVFRVEQIANPEFSSCLAEHFPAFVLLNLVSHQTVVQNGDGQSQNISKYEHLQDAEYHTKNCVDRKAGEN